MKFPNWTGKNPDAIWDMMCSNARTPAVIYLNCFDELPKELADEKEIVLKIFNRAHYWYGEIGEYLRINNES